MNPEPLNLEPLRELAAQRQRLVRRALRIYTQEIEALLRTGCADRQRIEHLLDNLLAFCFDDDMLLLFKKLCRHYFPIDPQATADYVHAYRDVWDAAREAGNE